MDHPMNIPALVADDVREFIGDHRAAGEVVPMEAWRRLGDAMIASEAYQPEIPVKLLDYETNLELWAAWEQCPDGMIVDGFPIRYVPHGSRTNIMVDWWRRGYTR